MTFRMKKRQNSFAEVVAEDEDQVVGWADFGPSRDGDSAGEMELYAMYVDPAYFRRGIGSLLWNEVVRELAAQERKRLAVWVLSHNASARSFYESMGGKLDEQATKACRQGGAELMELRYWCPC